VRAGGAHEWAAPGAGALQPFIEDINMFSPQKGHSRSGAMWCPLALVLPIVLRGTPVQLPYVVEAGLDILVDSGASVSYLRRAVLDAGGPVARLAAGAQSVEDTAPLQLPDGCGGILGFDALGAAASVEVDLDAGALRLGEAAPAAAPRRGACVATATAFPGAANPYPCVDVAVYGAAECAVAAIVDTGTPLTIANGALAAAAGLLDDADAAPPATVGVDGATTALRPCRAAGLVVGGAVALAAEAPVLVGDLPQWAQLGVPPGAPACILGLDVLGRRFRLARTAGGGAARPRKKSRAPPAAGPTPPTPGDTFALALY